MGLGFSGKTARVITMASMNRIADPHEFALLIFSDNRLSAFRAALSEQSAQYSLFWNRHELKNVYDLAVGQTSFCHLKIMSLGNLSK